MYGMELWSVGYVLSGSDMMSLPSELFSFDF